MSSKTRRWVLFGLALVTLAFLFAVCTPVGGANAATRTDGYTPVGEPKIIAAVAEQVATRSGAHCWVWKAGWHTTTASGLRAATYGVDVKWCSGRHMRKVTDIVYNMCSDWGRGGYTYIGCDKQHGSTGYESYGAQTYWHYKLYLPVVGDLRYLNPHVAFQLHANGGVTGTVWYW